MITTPGYYFVYSQMFYCDVDKPTMGHAITINRKTFIQGFSSPYPNHTRKYNTNYIGALIRMSAGDRIGIRPTTRDAMYYMNPKSSFFGAFLVYPV